MFLPQAAGAANGKKKIFPSSHTAKVEGADLLGNSAQTLRAVKRFKSLPRDLDTADSVFLPGKNNESFKPKPSLLSTFPRKATLRTAPRVTS